MKLSYIVTVYNTENMIHRCMSSLFEQGLNNDEYEILLVDNGSTDHSGAICDDYSDKYDNVRTFHLENLGAGASRNYGVKVAKGNYIWYIDSDDLIEPNVAQILVNTAIERNVDVLSFDFQLVWENSKLDIIKRQPVIVSCNMTKEVMSGEEYSLNVGMPSAQWCSLYRRDFLIENSLSFIEKITYEDQDYTPRAYYLAKRASHIHKMVYNYVQREGSITKRTDQQERRAGDYLKVCDSLYDFTVKNVKKGTPAYYYFMGKITFDFAQSLRFCHKSYAIVKEYGKKPYYPLYINSSVTLKERIKYMLINVSIPMYIRIYKLIK